MKEAPNHSRPADMKHRYDDMTVNWKGYNYPTWEQFGSAVLAGIIGFGLTCSISPQTSPNSMRIHVFSTPQKSNGWDCVNKIQIYTIK